MRIKRECKIKNEEKPKTKVTQVLTSISSFSRGRQTFADLLIKFQAAPICLFQPSEKLRQ